MASWMSFWNKRTRDAQRRAGVDHGTDAHIWVPYGEGKLATGDTVYCVAIDRGELRLYGRLDVGRTAPDSEHAESIDVWGRAGSDWWAEEGTVVPPPVADEIAFLKADGTTSTFSRDGAGRLSGSAFQGRASIRELVAGAPELERLIT